MSRSYLQICKLELPWARTFPFRWYHTGGNWWIYEIGNGSSQIVPLLHPSITKQEFHQAKSLNVYRRCLWFIFEKTKRISRPLRQKKKRNIRYQLTKTNSVWVFKLKISLFNIRYYNILHCFLWGSRRHSWTWWRAFQTIID